MMIWTNDKTDQCRVTVTVSDKKTLLSNVRHCFEADQGFSVATLNLDHVVKLRRDPAFLSAYAAHTHVTADGNPIVWLSRLAGQKDIKLVPGSELIEPLAEIAAQEKMPVAFFGSTEASLEAAAHALGSRFPDLEIVLKLAPPMGFDPVGIDADGAIKEIENSGARLVFLALGAPKQERFAAYAQSALPKAGFLSIGAGLDFISGQQKRAPYLVRAFAAEWLWRMLGNPKRLAARYGSCLLALPGLVLEALRSRWAT